MIDRWEINQVNFTIQKDIVEIASDYCTQSIKLVQISAIWFDYLLWMY